MRLKTLAILLTLVLTGCEFGASNPSWRLQPIQANVANKTHSGVLSPLTDLASHFLSARQRTLPATCGDSFEPAPDRDQFEFLNDLQGLWRNQLEPGIVVENTNVFKSNSRGFHQIGMRIHNDLWTPGQVAVNSTGQVHGFSTDQSAHSIVVGQINENGFRKIQFRNLENIKSTTKKTHLRSKKPSDSTLECIVLQLRLDRLSDGRRALLIRNSELNLNGGVKFTQLFVN